MLLLPFLLFGLPFALALALSWHPSLGAFRQSMLNPLLLIAAYIVLVAGDFASMGLTGSGQIARHYISASAGALTTLQVKYVAMLLAALIGIASSFQLSRPTSRSLPSRPVDVRIFATTSYIVVFVIWFVLLLQHATNGLSLASAAEIRRDSLWDSNLFVFSLALLPALSYLLPRQPYKVILPIVIGSLILLLFSGSRTRIIFVLIPFVFYLARVRTWRLGRPLFAICVVGAGFLALVGLNYRFITSVGHQATFAELTQASNIFNLNDVSFAETNAALSRLPQRARDQYTGQDMVGFVFAAVPRSIVPFKPLAGSNQFTTVFDPVNWRIYKRGLTIGGVSELEFDYPFPMALVMVFLFGAAWAWGFVQASSSKTIHGFAWTIASYVMLYTFLKSDIQSSAQILSISIIYTLFVKAFEVVIRGSVPKPAQADRPPRQSQRFRALPRSHPRSL